MLAVLSTALILFSITDAFAFVNKDLSLHKETGDTDTRTQQLSQQVQRALVDQKRAEAEAERGAEQKAVAEEKLKAAYQRSEAIMRNYTQALKITATAVMTEKENVENQTAVALARNEAYHRKLHLGSQLLQVIRVAQESREQAVDELAKRADEVRDLKNLIGTQIEAAGNAAKDYDEQRELLHKLESILEKSNRVKELQTGVPQVTASETTLQDDFRPQSVQRASATSVTDEYDEQGEWLGKLASILGKHNHVKDLRLGVQQATATKNISRDNFHGPFSNLRKISDGMLAGDNMVHSRHHRYVPHQKNLERHHLHDTTNQNEGTVEDDMLEYILASHLQKLVS